MSDDTKVELVLTIEEGDEPEVAMRGTYTECRDKLRKLNKLGIDLVKYDLRSVETGRFMSWVL